MVNPFKEAQIYIDRIGAIFRNCGPNLLNKLTSHEEVIHIFSMSMTEGAISININPNTIEVASGGYFSPNKFSSENLYLRK